MPGLTCNACNMEFIDESERNLHYKSDWHRYNLKRKVAGVPGVTEELFDARQSALAQEKGNKSDEAPMLYTCGICSKGYRSIKAHEQHLKSRSHVIRVGTGSNGEEDKAIIRPLPRRFENKDSDDEWIDVDSDEELALAAAEEEEGEAEKDDLVLDPTCCFMCDENLETLESCMVHMHKYHGFFIPDVEYLKDPEGLLTYVGLKVKRDFMCMYCNEDCRPFSSLEAVRKHMEAKSHCKLHYGDGDEDEDAELEEFYDYSSSYVDEAGDQIVVGAGETDNTLEVIGGSELVIKSENATTSRTLGSREFMRYYRQKPRPTSQSSNQIVASLSSRYKSLGLKTVPSKEETVKMKVLKEMSKRGENMRTKIAMKSNVIRNLPNNVPY